MSMMNIRKVGVFVLQWCVLVHMCVWLITVPVKVMTMLVMGVMPKRVSVQQLCMFMLMGVVFGQMEPYTNGHHCSGYPETGTGELGKYGYRNRGAHKRCRREVCPRACRA